MEWYEILITIGIGLIAGFINTLAGSGSLLTLPLLMFMGLPANVANGTNRIAILLQNVVGVSSFKQQKVFTYKEGIWLAIPAIIGSILGAILAVDLDEELMEKFIGGLLVFMFFFILYKPERWLKGKAEIKSKPGISQIIIFFFIGIYGGFIQAGVGFFLLAGLVLGAGFDLVKANAIKVFIVLLYTVFALAIFMMNDQVNYVIGFVLAIGNMSGAYIASRLAVKKGTGFIRIILLATLAISASKLFGLF
ncbi:MAG: sulfite exporter TauE/SafE family protein [Bacteroidetes bacterium]|nr:MAG: sulfite exporter TauE/SafE family protein [Bacteroidota bacterium]